MHVLAGMSEIHVDVLPAARSKLRLGERINTGKHQDGRSFLYCALGERGFVQGGAKIGGDPELQPVRGGFIAIQARFEAVDFPNHRVDPQRIEFFGRRRRTLAVGAGHPVSRPQQLAEFRQGQAAGGILPHGPPLPERLLYGGVAAQSGFR